MSASHYVRSSRPCARTSKEPGISGAQLARRITVTAQSMNGLLRSMEKLGVVVREPHPENRRTDCWYMTTYGLKEMQTGGQVVDGVMGRIRAAMSKADAAKLVELLQQCAAALQAEPEALNRRAAKRA
jgi:DNA-binding MarR family transcriptional regulator